MGDKARTAVNKLDRRDSGQLIDEPMKLKVKDYDPTIARPW